MTQQAYLLRQLLRRNYQLILGHYCADDEHNNDDSTNGVGVAGIATSYQVVLTKIGDSMRRVVEILDHSCRQPRNTCQRLVESAPVPVARFSTKREAEAMVSELAAVGAKAVII